MPAYPPLGARVVLRYRRPAGSVPSQSDVIGILEAHTPQVAVRAADGELATFSPADVLVLKAVPPRPVRTGAIRALEHAAAFANPAAECEWVAGWVARAGLDGLANSAVPLADPSMPEGGYFHDPLGEPTLRALAAWYAARGLPLQLRLPDRLVRPPAGWLGLGERLVLTADLAPGPADGVGYLGAGALGAGAFGAGDSVRRSAAPDDAVWAGLKLGASESDLGPRIAALMNEASGLGARQAYLELGQEGAAALEGAARGLGFADHHRVRHVRLELG